MNCTYAAGGARVGLDAAAILTVDNLGVLEADSVNGIVALTAN